MYSVVKAFVHYPRAIAVLSVRFARRRPNNPRILRRDVLSDNPDEPKQPFSEDSDDLEANFLSLGKTHKQHINEMEIMQEKEKYLIVKRKYFKEEHINFLAWGDKQQIRYLHQSDPDEWTIEKLSASFPASPDVIKKILKSHWEPKNESRIRHHDKTVEENWKLFKQGKLNLPHELVQHLRQFSERTPSTALSATVAPKPSKPTKTYKSSEFSEIIASYQRIKKPPEQKDENVEVVLENRPQKPPDSDTYVIKSLSRGSRNPITLGQLKEDLTQLQEQGEILNDSNERLLQNLSDFKTDDNDARVPVSYNAEFISLDGKRTGIISLMNEEKLHTEEYPIKINIPKKSWKRGYTYKVNDCYYDDDGMFLYRVPGMK